MRHFFTFGKITAEGKTLKQAKENALAQAEKILNQNYALEIFHEGGIYGILYSTPHGYETRLLNYEPGQQIFAGVRYGQSITQDRQHARDGIMLHVAQTSWNKEKGFNVPEVLEGNKILISDYLGWVKFQLAFQEAKDRGLSYEACYAHASAQ